MDDQQHILEKLMAEGFHMITDQASPRAAFDFKITPYSLNTKLSFRFEGLAHFVEFLKRADAYDEQRAEVLQKTFTDLGLQEGDFFWVNFFGDEEKKEM